MLLTLGFNTAATPQSSAQSPLRGGPTLIQTDTIPDIGKTPVPRQHKEEPRGKRYAAIVMDASTGEILYERNAATPLNPASTTKIMTSYLVFEALREGKLTLDQKLTVSTYAGKFGGPSYRTNLGLRKGAKITVRDALKAILVHSSNDASVVLAEAVSGSEAKFAKKMNATAARLGMTSSHFVNANGWPDRPLDRQKASVRDMALLCQAIVSDFPQYTSFFNQRHFTYKNTSYENTNRLLMDDYEGLDISKTGWVRESGSNLVASAEKDGKRVIAVVFGAKNRFERKDDMTLLLDYGFLRFQNPEAVYPPTPEQYIRAEMLAVRQLPLRRIEPRPLVRLTSAADSLTIKVPVIPLREAFFTATEPLTRKEKRDARKKEKQIAREKMPLHRRDN